MARRLCRRLHVVRPRSRRGPAPARTRSPLHFPLSSSPRAAPCPQQAPPLPTARRRHRAHSPPRKRVAQSISSLAVVFSTFSTSPSVQSSLGKDERVVFFHRHRGYSRQRWRSIRPAVLTPLPSLLYLALGHRSTAKARRVSRSRRSAVISPEPAMPRPCAAVLIANPGSHANSFNLGFH